jgi:hypothetical protein
MEEDYREDYRNYRKDYRNDYRNYREDYRDYDMRGGRRNYREKDTYNEDLDMVVDELRYLYRKIEDVSEMATNAQEKSTLMKVSQSTKEGYQNLKSLMHKSM